MLETSLLTIFTYALLTALATGLGALPFLFFRKISKETLSLSNAGAAGLMLTASFTLIVEGIAYGLWQTISGALAGLVFIVISNRKLEAYPDLSMASLNGADARKSILIFAVMTVHSVAEGVGIGVSFGGEEGLGIFITAAIALHNIPEGLAISLVMVPRGMRISAVAFYCILSSLPQPLMAVPAFAFVEAFQPFLPTGLGFAAGAMIWMVFSELIPEANAHTSPNKVAVTVTLATVAMFLLQEFLR